MAMGRRVAGAREFKIAGRLDHGALAVGAIILHNRVQMDDEQQLIRATGPNHTGGDHTSPYPVSRMAPAIELVDLARQIERADHMLAVGVNGKLEIIAEQIRGLQARAQEILDAAQRDAELHRARCNFVKRPGRVYHLYRSESEAYFSLLSPDDWRGRPPHTFAGSYELLTDMTWQLRREA